MRKKKELEENLSMKQIWMRAGRLFFILIFVYAVGFIGSAFVTPDRLNWYNTLPLSELTPPSWVFSTVWSLLYLLMALAAFFAWEKATPRYFALQLICTGLWPFVFFYMHSIIGGIVVILLMLLFLGLAIKSYYKTTPISAILLVPQFLWGMFALYLNVAILF